MEAVHVHPRVLGYLGRALSLELSAVQQYMTQACLLESWGDLESAQRFRQETVEEMQHAERIVKHMLSLGVGPGASKLRVTGHAENLLDLIRLNGLLEADLIQHYGQAVRFCLAIGDTNNEMFFRSLWNDEHHHADNLREWQRHLAAHNSD